MLRGRKGLRFSAVQKRRFWPIASFRRAAEFGRYRSIADINQAAPIKLDL
jgi:hypothetical protein